MNSKQTNKIYRMTLTAILIALIFVMSFTPLGYLNIGIVSITFMSIPVVIGAITEGPFIGAVLGFVFGVTSLVQALKGDPFGSALLSINPWFTAILCIVPRALMGFLSGLIFKAVSSKTKSKISYIISSFSSGFFNTVFFVGLLLLFFFKSDYIQSIGTTVPAVLSAMITFNAVIEWIACTLVGTAVSVAVKKANTHHKH